jgi:hypothetical protein
MVVQNWIFKDACCGSHKITAEKKKNRKERTKVLKTNKNPKKVEFPFQVPVLSPSGQAPNVPFSLFTWSVVSSKFPRPQTTHRLFFSWSAQFPSQWVASAGPRGCLQSPQSCCLGMSGDFQVVPGLCWLSEFNIFWLTEVSVVHLVCW